jgi:hypothetical protein
MERVLCLAAVLLFAFGGSAATIRIDPASRHTIQRACQANLDSVYR